MVKSFGYIIFIIPFVLASCGVAVNTGKVVMLVGEAGMKTVATTGKIVAATGKATAKGAITVVDIAKGKQKIDLIKNGNSLYANVKLNNKEEALFLVDTGASYAQISRLMADKLKLNLNKGDRIIVKTANGQAQSGVVIYLDEIKVDCVKVKNIKAIVLDQDNLNLKEGLLGMSFLNNFIFEINVTKSELILHGKS